MNDASVQRWADAIFYLAAFVDFLYRIYESHCHKFKNDVYYRDGKRTIISENEVNSYGRF